MRKRQMKPDEPVKLSTEVTIKAEPPDPNAPRIVMYDETNPEHRVLAIYGNGRIEVDPTEADKTARKFVEIVQELSRPKTPTEDHKAILALFRKDHGCDVWAVDDHCIYCSRRADLVIGAGWTRRI